MGPKHRERRKTGQEEEGEKNQIKTKRSINV
jgi:hypothetical protein